MQRRDHDFAHARAISADARRSASGQSTNSRASSVAPDQGFAIHNRFARLRDSTISESGSRHGTQAADDLNGNIASLQRFNNSQAGLMDVQHASHPYPFHPPVSAVPDALYNGSISRPSSRQTDVRERTSTPQIGETTGTELEKEKRRGGNTTAANEKELRDMLEKSAGRDLLSIAAEVRSSERSQKSERAKQLYAMRWLQRCCKESAGNDSVPRNRVYTFYAQRCGNDRVDTLNPASFGKLVRIIFPGIQTRRLGQRGESKYHYVKLILMDEQEAASADRAESPQDFGASLPADDADFGAASRFGTETNAFPNDDTSFLLLEAAQTGDTTSQGRVYAPTSWQEDYRANSGPSKYVRLLKFATAKDRAHDMKASNEPFTLPDVTPYLPEGTDPELADALVALYRSHCTMLVDNMRFVKEKSFFKLFASFSGILTSPVSRLFNNAAIAPWIRLCDWHVYREIIRFVSPLALQVIPPPVWSMINRVKSEITDHITRNFSHAQPHVFQAKLEPATLFSKLLERLLRVNETAHASANLLMNDHMRNAMWTDWVKTVQPKRIVEAELSSCGFEEAIEILTLDIRTLLEPLDDSLLPESGPEFLNAGFGRRFGDSEPSNSDIVERWATFLQTLPDRFPRANARALLYAIGAIGSAALRDLTVAQAPSFGSWWITKCWVDEMMTWLAEMGGFLDARGPGLASASKVQSWPGSAFGETRREASRPPSMDAHPGGLGIDFNSMPNFAPTMSGDGRDAARPPAANFRFQTKRVMKSPLKYSITEEQENLHDDSGIGMSLLGNDGFDYH